MDPLLSPKTLKREFSATIAQTHFVEQSRRHIRHILQKSDPRLLLIVGPCSIHDLNAAKEYAKKLRSLANDIANTFFVVMRVYFEKPRTILGWKGLMYDPHLDGSHDMNTGLRWTRNLLLELADLQLPTAAEILDPISAHYFGDLLSWSCIGARTSPSQIHRQAASGFPMPVGFKNPTDGNIAIAVNGVMAASHPHTFIGIDERGQAKMTCTKGNTDTHVVLRGGANGSNYDAASISRALHLLQDAALPERLIVDCSHDNSGGKEHIQPQIFHHVLEQICEGNTSIVGFILESNVYGGHQQLPLAGGQIQYGISVTDPCLDWESTEKLIRQAKKAINSTANATALCRF